MKIEIYRETETEVQYLNSAGRWTNDRTQAALFTTEAEAKRFASNNGEDISASYAPNERTLEA